MLRRLTAVVLGAALVAGPAAMPTSSASSYGPGSVVKDQPADGTPHVLDGRVLSVVRVGDTMLLGGTFTQARNDGDSTVMTRTGLLAFDVRTNRILSTFNPAPNGAVNVILPSSDGQTVYIGGAFTTVAGGSRKYLAQLRVGDGSLVQGFNSGDITGKIRDLRLSRGRLWVGGAFTHVQGKPQAALATLNPTTGAFDPYMRRTIAGIHNGGYPTVMKMDITPDQNTLVAIGNFDTLDGVKRHQIFELDLSGTTAQARDWQTSFFEARCSTNFYTYMHDVDISPDGSFFVVVTTGAYGGTTSPACDSSSRWEIASTGTDIKPSWRDLTGGDTTWAVEVTDSAVYTGGHARWQNNPFAGDAAGPGAVSRPGIAALDPINGLPLTWNPTRDRGVGVFDFLDTDEGLWVASDTDRIGAYRYHGRIALMPAGGETWPGVHTPGLPNTVYSVTSSGLGARSATGPSTFQQPTTPAQGPVDWSRVKGAFMINGSVYLGMNDGTFVRRSFDGQSWGPSEPVDNQDLLVPLTAWQSDIKAMTGLFYDSGRLYFTLAGDSNLYYRYFTPQSRTVGAERFVASTSAAAGVPFSSVRGMFLADDRLYFSTGTDLRAADWREAPTAGAPVAGTSTVVSGPTTDGNQWGAPQALFLAQDAAGRDDTPPAPAAPEARFTSSCAQLACSFDASDSTGPTDLDYSWSFGDGAVAQGVTAEHAFDTPGTYTVSLEVTDTDGRTDTATAQVSVSQAGLELVAGNNTNGNRTSHTVQVPSSVQPGDRLMLFMAGNSSTATTTGPVGWTAVPGAQATASGMTGRVWTKVAEPGDAGRSVTVTTSIYLKSDLSVSAYRATGGATIAVGAAQAVARSGDGSLTASTPTVPLSGDAQSWVLSYWGDKSSNAPTWTAPASERLVTASTGTGSGALSAVLTTSRDAVRSASGGGLTATLSSPPTALALTSVVLEVR